MDKWIKKFFPNDFVLTSIPCWSYWFCNLLTHSLLRKMMMSFVTFKRAVQGMFINYAGVKQLCYVYRSSVLFLMQPRDVVCRFTYILVLWQNNCTVLAMLTWIHIVGSWRSSYLHGFKVTICHSSNFFHCAFNILSSYQWWFVSISWQFYSPLDKETKIY